MNGVMMVLKWIRAQRSTVQAMVVIEGPRACDTYDQRKRNDPRGILLLRDGYAARGEDNIAVFERWRDGMEVVESRHCRPRAGRKGKQCQSSS